MQSDAAAWLLWPEVAADFVCVRLHGHAVTYCSRNWPRALAAWAERIAAWRRQGRGAEARESPFIRARHKIAEALRRANERDRGPGTLS